MMITTMYDDNVIMKKIIGRSGIIGIQKATQTHTNTFAESMQGDTREAVLKLSGGAGRFIISEPTTELIKADTKQTVGSYSMSVERDETTHIPTIELKPTDEENHIDLKDGNYRKPGGCTPERNARLVDGCSPRRGSGQISI